MASKKTISANNINVTGDFIAGDQYNYYYTGDFASLAEYYISPESVFQRVRTDDFVGREWLTAKVDAFLNDPLRKSGAFLLIGDAGVGKTSFMAHLVKERGYLHLFAEQVPGQALLQRALQSLGSQLVTRYQIDPYKDRDTMTQLAVFPDFLERLLRLAANTLTDGEKIVIVCDALDEAGTFPDGNVFGLPNVLPDGVYLILSQRPVNVKLPNIEPLNVKLEAQGADNLGDMEKYLREVAQRAAVADQLRAKNYSDVFFIQTLKEKSLGVWMYLHYVIKEIEGGSRAPLDLSELPTGLVGYYAEYWHKWRTNKRGEILPKWRNLYAPILSTLAAAQDAITAERLTQWARVKAQPDEVQALLGESWRAFVTEKTVDGKKAYAPYHLSFRDFITGKVDLDKLDTQRANLVRDLSERTVAAHARIVHAFESECGGQWEKLIAQEYPRLHLSAHLNGAGEYEKLRILLTEGEEKIKWAEAREQKEETYAGYLNDLRYVWDYAEREQNYALAIRCMLIENSIHSLAANIPPELLAELAKAGIWSIQRCLGAIRQNGDDVQQRKAIELLAPILPVEHKHELFLIANEIKNEYSRAKSLSALIPHLADNLKPQMLITVYEIKDEYTRANTLSVLAPYLKGELKIQAIQRAWDATCKIKDEPNRAHAVSILAPYLNDNCKKQALIIAHEIEEESDRVKTLSALVPYLSEELKKKVTQDMFAITPEIENEVCRVYALSALAPHLNIELQTQVIQDALSAIRRINDDSARVRAFSSIVPHLKENCKAQALIVAREIENISDRIEALTTLAPCLGNELKAQVIQDAIVAACEIEDESLQTIHLSYLAPYLDDNLKMQVLIAACEIEKESSRDRVLSALAPHLSEESITQALIVARTIKDNSAYIHFLSALVPYLNNEIKMQIIHDVLVATRKINDETYRTFSLSALLPYLKENLRAQMLQNGQVAICEIKDKSINAGTLSFFERNMNDEQIVNFLGGMLYVEHDSRLFTLEQILSVWYQNEYRSLERRIIPFIKYTAHEHRKNGLKDAGALTPALVHFSGEEIVPELYRAIQDVARWWP